MCHLARSDITPCPGDPGSKPALPPAIRPSAPRPALLSLPEGVRLDIFYDRSHLVESTFETVAHSVLLGITLIVLMLLLFLGSPKVAGLVALTIPFALLFALVLMHLVNIPIGLLSIGAIDFGIIVDGAVIMAENIVHRLGNLGREASRREVRRAILAAAIAVQSGRNDSGTDPFPPSRMEMMISPKLRARWQQFDNKHDLVNALGRRFREEYPTTRFNFTQPIIDSVTEDTNGTSANLALDGAILKGAQERLRPILMTSSVAILGLLPASLATGLGSDVQRPLATVIVWGLCTSMLLTLFVVPVFYRILQPRMPPTPAEAEAAAAAAH